MSKSILLVDKPNTCLDCRFCRELHEGVEACCELSDEPEDNTLCRMIDVDYCQEKPNWCPIRDLPEKKEVRNFCIGTNDYAQQGYQQGWNMCISEILREYN